MKKGDLINYNGEYFKPNQKIVCINNQPCQHVIPDENPIAWDDVGQTLELNKTYLVLIHEQNIGAKLPQENRVFIHDDNINENSKIDWFYPHRFLSIKNYRKIKLNKLKTIHT